MAVGNGSRFGRKLDDGSSAINKRYYGRSRKKRVQPAPEDEADMDLPATATTTEVPELPASQAANTSKENPVELLLSSPVATPSAAMAISLPDPQPGPSDCHSSSLSSSSSPPSPSPSGEPHDIHRASVPGSSSSTTLQQSNTTATVASEGSEGDPDSSPDYSRDLRRRRADSDDSPSMFHQSNGRRGRARGGSRRAPRDGSFTQNARSRSLEGASSTPATDFTTSCSEERSSDGSSSSSVGRSSGSDGSYSGTESSTEGGSRKRRYRTNKNHSSRSRHRKYRYKNRARSDRSRESGPSGRYRSDHHHGRKHSRCRTKERTITGGGRRHSSGSRDGRRRRRRRRRRHRSRDSGNEDRTPREDRTRRRRKNGRRRERDRGDGSRNKGGRSRPSGAHKTRHDRAGGEAAGRGKGSADVPHLQQQSTPLPARTSIVVRGEGRISRYADAVRKREELRELTLKAVVELQRFARGFVARNRVAGRREAIALLRSACFGVVINIIDSYIREDVAPGMISDTLADGFEGGTLAERQRAEAAAEAHDILEETSASMIGELVAMSLTEEADSHLDVVFVRDRRNPLLRTVDDVVADTLRVCIREGVVEVVRECAEEFMIDRRIFAIVEGFLEDGVMESVGPIASEVYHNAIGQAVYSEIMEELCAEEGRSVVAEIMAPFEDQLVELQREKDIAAIKATALSAMVKGLQLQHAARTVGQRGRLVLMSDINRKTLNLLLAGRFLAILRAAEANRLRVSTSPLLFMLFRRLVVRTGRNVLLEELSRELDRDETALHALELERIDEVDQQRLAARGRAAAAELPRLPVPPPEGENGPR